MYLCLNCKLWAVPGLRHDYRVLTKAAPPDEGDERKHTRAFVHRATPLCLSPLLHPSLYLLKKKRNGKDEGLSAPDHNTGSRSWRLFSACGVSSSCFPRPSLIEINLRAPLGAQGFLLPCVLDECPLGIAWSALSPVPWMPPTRSVEVAAQSVCCL